MSDADTWPLQLDIIYIISYGEPPTADSAIAIEGPTVEERDANMKSEERFPTRANAETVASMLGTEDRRSFSAQQRSAEQQQLSAAAAEEEETGPAETNVVAPPTSA